jgi:putative DNA primase/helicase
MSTPAAFADEYARAGLSILPIETDGTKGPKINRLPRGENGKPSWTPLQHAIADETERRRLFHGAPVGVGIIGGAVSGNLEIIDFDKPDLFAPFMAEAELLAPGLVGKLPLVKTPGGYHLYLRCEHIEGNKKLAQYPAEDEEGRLVAKTGIETRGEGGYVVAPGSPAECHDTGKLYQHVAGPAITSTPTITGEQRAILFQAARSLNAWFDDEPIENKRAKSQGENETAEHTGLMPGDDYAQKTSWPEILEPHGWHEHHTSGERTYWTRPGKAERGWSATTGATSGNGNELLCVFSTNAHPFQVPAGKPCGTFGKFGAYALLNHGGDFAAAAKALYAAGYGDRVKADGRNGAAGQSGEPNIWQPEGRTDAANGRRLVLKHGQDIRWVDTWGKWMPWNGQRWVVDTACQVEALAKSVGRELFAEIARAIEQGADEKLVQEITRHGKATLMARGWQNMMTAARSEIGIAVQPDRFDADPWLLNCANGTVDLRTGELRPHCREDYLTKLAPVEYLPASEAECPHWEAFIDDIFDGDQSLVGLLRRLLGYCLTGDVREQVLPILWGKGSNGKSTLLNVLLDVLGDYAMKAPPDLLMDRTGNAHPTERADLFGKRLVVANETEDGRRLAESLVKDLTGGDRIRARRMREDFWEFTPQHKILLATNHKPEVRGGDHAIWRRLALIPFTETFWDQEKGETGTENRQMDKSLPAKLKAEAPGILGWLVRGCLEWQRDGLNLPDKVRTATAEYRGQQDKIGLFIEQCCVVDSKAFVGATVLFKAYQDYTADSSLTQTRFGTAMGERGYHSDRFSAGPLKGRMGWFGVGLLGASEQCE